MRLHIGVFYEEDGNLKMEEKRRKYSTSSDDSDTTDSHVASWLRRSEMATTKSNWTRPKEKKPSEVFRTDLITAMKIPDYSQLNSEDYYLLADPWRQEWEKGVQVPANTEAIPEPVIRVIADKDTLAIPQSTSAELQPSEYVVADTKRLERICRYDLDEMDAHWLELVNVELRKMAVPELDELTMERVMEEIENQCYENMTIAIETEEGLGIEYDEDVVCDVCRSPEGEDGNEMVFCDKCNICIHQACYGILKVPTGSWLCRTCALGVQPKCLLCPKRGGALKPTRSGTKWVHVSCALWIPEVSIGCPEKMEPITKISHIPASRWALSCSLCKECTGTCIQCSMPSCVTAFHVTCAFDHNLDMKTILLENDEVRFKSFCLEHSSSTVAEEARTQPADAVSPGEPNPSSEESSKVSLRKQKLQQLEEDFYDLVQPSDVADSLGLLESVVDFVYQHWKLKRKSNFNKPLLPPKTDEVDNLAQQEQDILYRRLKLFTHLRQDLERVRNLCYMVTRREKMKHSICKVQEQIFHLQTRLIEENLHQEHPVTKINAKKKGRDGRKSSPKKKEKFKSKSRSLLGQLGLSSSFPIDRTVFKNWLPQSVQITTEDMLNQWSLNNGHHEDNTTGLLSKELLQDEETLLSFMMDHSFKSPLKQPDAAKKGKSKIRVNSKNSKSLQNSVTAISESQQEDSDQWMDYSMKSFSQDSRTSRLGKGAPKSKTDHKRTSKPRKKDKRGSSHQPVLKASISHESSEVESLTDSNKEAACQSETNGPVEVPDVVSNSPRTLVRFKIPKEGNANRKSLIQTHDVANGPPATERSKVNLHFDNETDGYFSDAETSNSDTDSSSGRMQLSQLDSGNEDIVRMGILAS
nr:PREDICTED: protein Jade-2 isoform X1 [Latimeria chalumnae]|eukprot:XP_005989400.1 PREDICTED: protein Jade-2 isoform X1 [Latimeria chalumnae]